MSDSEPEHGIKSRAVILTCYCGHMVAGTTDSEAGERLYQHRRQYEVVDGTKRAGYRHQIDPSLDPNWCYGGR